jgi:hypothetical protein
MPAIKRAVTRGFTRQRAFSALGETDWRLRPIAQDCSKKTTDFWGETSMTAPTYIPGAEGTEGTIEGTSSIANGNVKVTLPGGTVVTGTTDPNNGKYRIPVPAGTPKGNAKVEITDPDSNNKDVGSTPIAALNPPAATITTVASVEPGSSLSVGGQTFVLGGSFSAIDTAVDYDPSSPTYGDVSGVIAAGDFDVVGSGSGGNVTLELNGDQPYTVNLADVWAAPDYVGQSVTIHEPISGMAIYNGTTGDFTGTVDVTDVFSEEGADNISLTYNLTSDFGPITGNISAIGEEDLSPPLCFLAGTRIATPRGEMPAEMLKPGDLVHTVSGAVRPLRWIGFGRTLVTPRNCERATPIVVRRHALAHEVPRRDLYLTRGHALYLDGVLIPVGELINHRSIAWVAQAQVVEYCHLELDCHDVVIAEGAAAESYRDDDNSPLFLNAATLCAGAA